MEALEIDQAPCARNRLVIGLRLGQHQAEKLPQRKRIGRTLGNGALGVQAFEIADQQQTEVAAGWQARAPLVRIGSLAEPLDESVEVALVEDLIQPLVEGMRGTARQVLGRHPTSRPGFACRFRLPIAIGDSVGTRDRSRRSLIHRFTTAARFRQQQTSALKNGRMDSAS